MMRCVEEARSVLRSKRYLFCVALTAFCAYGFEMTHLSIGIDDTALSLYYDAGLDPIQGRWVLYLLNKVLFLTKYAPVLPEVAGVLFLCLSAVLYCVLFRRILGEVFDERAEIMFSCLFISYPLISFAFRYYLHIGLGIGNVLTVLALLCFQDGIDKPAGLRKKYILQTVFWLWMAVGCYESLLVLFILGAVTILFLEGVYDRLTLSFRCLFREFLIMAVSVCLVMALRAAMIPAVTTLFKLEAPEVTTVGLRSIREMSPLFGADGREIFHMLIKRFWVVYHLNAFVFFPIAVYEMACVVFGVLSIFCAVRKRNIFFPVLFVAMLIIPFLMVLAEAKITYYRTCQYLPFYSALGVTILYILLANAPVKNVRISHALSRGTCIFACILWYNQVAWISADFRMEAQEYEYSREYLTGAVQDVMRRYGKEYPVVFVGDLELPHEFVKAYYVPYSSKRYQWIAGVMDLVDGHLKDKYATPEGYCFLNEGTLSMMRWAFDAFDGTNREMITFLRMHGYDFEYLKDAEMYRQIRSRCDERELPRWPEEGAVFLEDGYVIVHF